MRAVFLDRDGTLIEGIPVHERVDSISKIELFPDTISALTKLAKLDYKVFFVTNQAGIAEGLITLDEFYKINDKVLEDLSPSGIEITKTYLCPHGEDSDCECRKPKPKMLLDAAKEYDIDLSQSYMVGDRMTDVQTGRKAGTKTILVSRYQLPPGAETADFCADNLEQAVNFIAVHS